MAKTCAICGKGTSVGHHRKLLRGHRNVTGKRTFKPNLQRTQYKGKRVLACAQCIKTNVKAGRRSS